MEAELTTATLPKTDIYDRITQKIIDDLEKGELTWRMPWSSEHMAQNVIRPLRWNDEHYTGINILVLWATAAENGYSSPYWMTYNQAVTMKANVRKGEKGTQVVYADKFTIEEKSQNGAMESRTIPFLKSYTVFNANQIEDLSDAYYKIPEFQPMNKETRIAAIDVFFEDTRAEIVTGTKASYNLTTDKIQMPPFESFYDAMSYYATLAHEITHWTRHPSRLNRDFGRKKWGDEGYAKEELVAELGACFLGADLGFEPITKEQHAAYIQSWLGVLKSDKRFVFTAASEAQKAIHFLYHKTTPNLNLL